MLNVTDAQIIFGHFFHCVYSHVVLFEPNLLSDPSNLPAWHVLSLAQY